MSFSSWNLRPSLVIAALLIPIPAQAADEVDFTEDIAPVLEQRCWDCHGEFAQESGLRLDRRAAVLRGGDSGLPAVVPGEPDKSYLLEAVSHQDPDLKMPLGGEKLPEQDIRDR